VYTAFEKYIPNEQTNSPRISICGNLNINKEAAKELSLADYSHAQIEYDSDTKRMAMHLFKEDVGNCLVLCKRPGGGIQMNMRGFCNRFKISPQSPRALHYNIPKTGKPLILSFPEESKMKKEPMAEPPIKVPIPKKNIVKKENPEKEKMDYECVSCSYSNTAWKYNKSMEALGHPEVCPKCGGSVFRVESQL
jgi:hypothetical protein